MLHLILGRAGSGKSTRLTEAIAADVAAGKPTWLIIPEQQANLSERTMLPRLPQNAGLTFTITGFSRLAGDVAARFGGGMPPPMTSGLRALLMWSVLRDISQSPDAYVHGAPRNDTGLTDKLLETVNELRADGISPERLDEVVEQLPPDDALAPKLRYLSEVYATYHHALSEMLEGKPDDEIAHLAAMLAEYDYFEGGNVYVDSFSDFTAEEYAVLFHLLKQADNVTITLGCEDRLSNSDPSMLGLTETLARIRRLASEAGVEIDYTLLDENKRTTSNALRRIEHHLWDFSLRKGDLAPLDEGETVTRICASNVYAESEAVALHILDLVHHGTRYGDIAVFFRSSDTYRGVLDAALERYGIPYYFSEKTALTEKPLSRLLLSALRAVSHGFQSQDILTMLKTGLCPVDDADADRFEQYVAIWNINGEGFTQPKWTRNPDGFKKKVSDRGYAILDSANCVREALMTPLLQLSADCAGATKLPALAAALYRFMQQMQLSQCCAALAERELRLLEECNATGDRTLAAGYLKQAGETLRVYDTVCTTLTQISAHMPDLALTVDEFAAVLRMVFDKTEIASVPSLHDSVTLGAADTLRVENVAAAFVLGLNEGEFPAANRTTGLLSNDEKQQLRDAWAFSELDGRRDVLASNELFYVLRAMSKPSERLFVSTVRADSDGKAKTPSLPYTRLELILPDVARYTRTFDFSMIAPPTDVYDMSYASTGDGEDIDEREDAMPEEDRYTPVEPSAHDLSPEQISTLLGKDLYLSQSKIEKFVGCPYSYYCTYLLHLREREIARVDPADRGTFIHHLFEHFLRECVVGDGSLRLPDPSEIEPMTDRIVNDYIRSLECISLSDLRTLHVFRRMKGLALVLLRDILDELSHSAFRPSAFEQTIGDAKVPYYEIELNDGHRILLGGKVDRVDCYTRETENGEREVYLRVIDYKTGAKTFSIKDVMRGINMQMLIYLFSLCRPADTHPAGVLYVSTEHGDTKPEPSRTGVLLADEDVLAAMNDEWNKKYLAGIFKKKDGELSGNAKKTAQELEDLEYDIRTTLSAIGQDMLDGRAARKPSQEACRYCTLKDGCPEANRTKGKF